MTIIKNIRISLQMLALQLEKFEDSKFKTLPDPVAIGLANSLRDLRRELAKLDNPGLFEI